MRFKTIQQWDSRRNAALCIGVLFLSACSQGTPTEDTTTSVPQMVFRAWQTFKAGSYEIAAGEFGEAAAIDPGNAEAHLGLGWSLLLAASSATSWEESSRAFDFALDRGGRTPEALGGRASAGLAIGGAALERAISDAEEALVLAPSFEFAQLPRFGASSIRMVLAIAHVENRTFQSALDATEPLLPAPIDSQDASTWIADGVLYSTFESAVLAHVNQAVRLVRNGRVGSP